MRTCESIMITAWT